MLVNQFPIQLIINQKLTKAVERTTGTETFLHFTKIQSTNIIFTIQSHLASLSINKEDCAKYCEFAIRRFSATLCTQTFSIVKVFAGNDKIIKIRIRKLLLSTVLVCDQSDTVLSCTVISLTQHCPVHCTTISLTQRCSVQPSV